MSTPTPLTVRIDRDAVVEFDKRAKLMGRGRSELLREIIAAFNEGRLTIRKSKQQIQAEGIYE